MHDKCDHHIQATMFCSQARWSCGKELAAVTELDLPPMLVFDYPTVAALTDHLLALMPPKPAAAQRQALVRLESLCIAFSICQNSCPKAVKPLLQTFSTCRGFR